MADAICDPEQHGENDHRREIHFNMAQVQQLSCETEP